MYASDHINYCCHAAADSAYTREVSYEGRSRRHGLLSGLSVIDLKDVKLFGQFSVVQRYLSA